RLAHVEQARSAERVEPGRVLRGEKVTQIRLVRAQEAPAELRKADVVERFVRESVSRMTPGTPQRTVRRSLEEQQRAALGIVRDRMEISAEKMAPRRVDE